MADCWDRAAPVLDVDQRENAAIACDGGAEPRRPAPRHFAVGSKRAAVEARRADAAAGEEIDEIGQDVLPDRDGPEENQRRAEITEGI